MTLAQIKDYIKMLYGSAIGAGATAFSFADILRISATEKLKDFIAKTGGTEVPASKSLYDGLSGGISAVNRVAGKTQILEVSITSAANIGNVTVATVNTQPCLIKSIVLHADAAQTTDLTSAAIYGGAGNVITFISAVDAAQANLDAADRQVSWQGAVRLATGKTIVIDLQGTAGSAVDLTITVEYESCVNGGYLS